MQVRSVVFGFSMLLVGLVGGHGLRLLNAQGLESDVPDVWEIQALPYGQQSFFVIKHNVRSGETWVLDARKGVEDDAWLLLPEIDRRQ